MTVTAAPLTDARDRIAASGALPAPMRARLLLLLGSVCLVVGIAEIAKVFGPWTQGTSDPPRSILLRTSQTGAPLSFGVFASSASVSQSTRSASAALARARRTLNAALNQPGRAQAARLPAKTGS